MDDISAAVAQFLENPEAMGQLEAMAKQLGLAPEAPKPAAQPQPSESLLPGGLSPQLLGTLAGALQSSEEAAAAAKLFETLRQLRMTLAKQEHISPYMVFSDATLRDMVAVNPRTLDEMLEVKGVGEMKLAKYGQDFLDCLRLNQFPHGISQG